MVARIATHFSARVNGNVRDGEIKTHTKQVEQLLGAYCTASQLPSFQECARAGKMRDEKFTSAPTKQQIYFC
jgi:hypothetical protein